MYAKYQILESFNLKGNVDLRVATPRQSSPSFDKKVVAGPPGFPPPQKELRSVEKAHQFRCNLFVRAISHHGALLVFKNLDQFLLPRIWC